MTKGTTSKIAIVGMACRVPGAATVDRFWQNVCGGVESIRRLSRAELLAAGVEPDELDDPRHVPFGALIEDADRFDAAFFGLTAREAEIMDPQQRLFLECAWQALEHAGCDPARYDGAIGVFGGANFNTYLTWNLLPAGVFDEKPAILQAVLSNDKDYLATRVAYKLNLRGPAYTIQSGCSTSLVAVHLASHSLLNYECDLALAGGAAVDVQRGRGYWSHEGSVFAPDGHCRAFDARAQGTVFGNGVGLVVLKRYEDAVRDGDTVYAVILGSAVNNDGSIKVGFTAPSVTGQAEVIAEALADAGVTPDSIQYIEAHGTGTPLGDPIEIEALTKAFGVHAGRRRCAIGSVKTNVGHLDSAAGVTGLIKTVLALHHAVLPPSLHFEHPNPKIAFDRTPFYVNTELTPWPSGERPGMPRRAGVSSFGMGGTNAHVVLEQAEPAVAGPASRACQLLVWSARTPDALERATENLTTCLRTAPPGSFGDLAYTLQVGRAAFAHRRFLACDGPEAAVAALEQASGRVKTHHYAGQSRSVAFLFPGQGAQYPGMARELYEREPVFRQEIDECSRELRDDTGVDLLDALYAAPPDVLSEVVPLMQTNLAQPALFAVEYALARLWMNWGLAPAALLGHSLGEYVAGCIAGIFSRRDGLRIVTRRGQLMHELPPGAMTAVACAPGALELPASLALAAVNAPALSVVSGPPDEVERFERKLAASGVECRRLRTARAFHSHMVDPLIPVFASVFQDVRLSTPSIPLVSNVTGRWMQADEATNPRYWAEHLRRTVLFADGLQCLAGSGSFHLLEVGPGRTLAALALQQRADHDAVIVSSLPAAREELSGERTMLEAIGTLWQAGVPINWPAIHAGRQRRRVAAPTYPFERTRHWIEPPPDEAAAEDPDLKLSDPASWFHVPAWRQTPAVGLVAPDTRDLAAIQWLVFCERDGLPAAVVARLEQIAGPGRVAVVHPGDRFERIDERHYTIDPRSAGDYAALVDELTASGRRPGAIAHMWAFSCGGFREATPESIKAGQDYALYSVMRLTQALEALEPTRPSAVRILTANAYDVLSTEPLCLPAMGVLGAARVIPQERRHIDYACVDVDGTPAGDQVGGLAARIVAEFIRQRPDRFVAYRGTGRWVPTYEPVRLPKPDGRLPALRQSGTYVILGGLGRIGLTLAEHLATTARARLVLVGRSGLPARDTWGEWLARAADDDPRRHKARRILALEQRGADVAVYQADVADHERLTEVLLDAERRFGRINGVIAAAGIVDVEAFRPVTSLTTAECERQFRPKVDGLFALERALGDRSLDFCLVVSSLSSILGGLGYCAYAAANLFMDGFVRLHNRRHHTPWLAANFDAWRWTDLTDDVPAGSLARLALTPAEAADVFNRLVSASGADQIAISTSSLHARLSHWIESVGSRTEADVPDTTAEATGELVGQDRGDAGDPALTVTERAVIDIWRRVLGIDDIELNESFLDLGGNSLTAVQAISRIEQDLGVRVAIEEFIFQTAAQLATLCDQKLRARQLAAAVSAPAAAGGGLLRTLREAVARR